MKELFGSILRKIGQSRPQTPFEVRFWDGTETKYGNGPYFFKINIRSERAVKKVIAGGTLAFGEEYMAGSLDIEGDLQAAVSLYDEWEKAAGRSWAARLGGFVRTKFLSLPLRSFDRKNIRYHYDIGDDFYALWLDSTMTYSCAYFLDKNDSLEAAQNNKYAHICAKLRLKPGESLVDIGCGWGGMMFYAAKNHGAKCTGYTLSENQYNYVNNKIKEQGLSGQIQVYFQDYRKARGSFDKFISIGMFEHVGKKNYPEFFRVVKRILKPKGVGVLHTIGTTEDKPTDPWVLKYIFPGGFVPPLSLVIDNINRADLVFYDIEDLRIHYGLTLDSWATNFEKEAQNVKRTVTARLRDEIAAERFMRMWRLYLNGSAVSFKNGGNRLYQIIFSNGVDNEMPLTRGYIYCF